MNFKGFIYFLLPLFIYCFPGLLEAKTIAESNLSFHEIEISEFEKSNVPPVAINDTIIHYTGCGSNIIYGNVLANDFSPDGDEIGLYFINSPKIDFFSSEKDGSFMLEIPDGFTGVINFEYYITELNEKAFHALGEAFIYVYADNDCDGVADEIDLDNDNDGLLNIDEGNGAIDSDYDGITDDLDIDSDNDGIPDNVEWQKEDAFIHRSAVDLNKNGWDDKYDNYVGGIYYSVVDTDMDGVADNIDADSDDDGISDLMESKSYSISVNGEPLLLGIDSDRDGLDDVFDNVGSWSDNKNVCGSNAVLKDSNNNGIRDWRDFIDTENEADFFTYPNPASNYLMVRHVDMPYTELFEITIYDIFGRLLISKEISQHQSIDVSELEDAIYIVKIMVNGNAETQQFVVKH